MANQVVFSFIASDRYSAVARRVSQATQRVSRSFNRASVSAAQFGATATKAGEKMRNTSLVAAAAGAASLKAFGDLEQGVFNVLTLLDDETAVRKFEGRINSLAKGAVEMGFSIQDSTKALFDTVSAMGANEEAFQAFEEAQRLAIAGVTDLSIATDGITSIVNAYGSDVADATTVANAFFTAQKKGKTTVAALATNIGKVAPIAKSAGIGFKELLATTAQLTLGGLSTEEATTALRQAIAGLVKPSKDAEKVLRAMGVPVGATEIQAAGLGKTLSRLAVVGEKYPDLLSQAIPNIRAFTAAASLGSDELANVDSIIEQLNKDLANGTGLTEAFEKQQGAFNQEMARTFGQVKILAAMIGEALAPVVRGLGTAIKFVIGVLKAMGPIAGKIMAFLLGVTAIAAPILLFFGNLGVVVGAIAGAIVAALSAPIALIAVLVAAFVAAVSVVFLKFDTIKQKAADLKDAVLGFFGFGGGTEELDVKASGNVSRENRSTVDVNLNAPKGTVQSVKSQTTGDVGGLNLGVNLQEAL